MEDKQTQQIIEVEQEHNKEVWNAAIEAAIKSAINAIGYQDVSPLATHVEMEIRKLKK